ncbi:MAG: DNA-binding response regulator [Kangiella sp.]|nr:MAG: DNA-binding response regulator [Kangiella sp.]
MKELKKILLVEDDEKLAQLVKQYLIQSGFDVRVEMRGDLAIATIGQYQPDLLILDINLPGKDGLTICKEIRPTFEQPILMLTARNEDFDQVLGLEFGADDYVIKPAEPRVLLARINALLRRTQTQKIEKITELVFGQLKIDLASRDVFYKEEKVILSSHEFELLQIIAGQSGTILSRDYLFKNLYNREYDGLDRTMDVRISQLRRKLGDNAEEPFRIKTVWGKGYLFVADAW